MIENKKPGKICKCGHKLKPDHQNHKTFLGMQYQTGTKCNGITTYDTISIPCCCTKFLDRRFPTKYDKAMMLTCMTGIGLAIFAFGTIIASLSLGLDCHTQQCNQAFDKPIWSLRDIASILIPITFVICLWTSNRLWPNDYFSNKKRKVEPIQDDQNEQKSS